MIAIDGPTASGKGTIAQRVAAALGWRYLDSGALYRITALQARRAGVALDDGAGLADLAASIEPEFVGDRVLLGGDDISDAIRAESIGVAASRIAVLPPVRRALVDLQRAARRAPGLVADGRDMGTVIFPDAVLKIFLTASVGSRAERRHKQLIAKGFPANIDSLSKDLEARDARDSQRSEAPLRPAEDARVIDSTELSIEDTVRAVLDLLGRHPA